MNTEVKKPKITKGKIEFTPTKLPYCCPVCGGNGLVPGGFYDSISSTLVSSETTEKCRSCVKGIIWG